MPIDSTSLWRGGFSTLRGSAAGSVAGNPIVVTLIITAICMVIMYAMLKPKADHKATFRCFMYTSLVVGIVLYAHHSLMRDTVQQELNRTGSGRIVSEIQNYKGGGVLPPIQSSFVVGMPQSPAPAPQVGMEPMSMPNPWGFRG